MITEKKSNLNKTDIYSILTGVFCACLLISNILGSKTFTLYEGILLPCAVIVFPITYLLNDVLSEIYGYTKTKKVIFLGFFLNLFAVIMFNIAMNLPAGQGGYVQAEAFNIVLGSTFRILIASFLAFLIGSLVNSYVMVWLKEKAEKYLFFRCIFSTICGEGIDSTIFITIAFIRIIPILLVMILTQVIFKTLYEIFTYPITKIVVKYIRTLPV
jgi:uncharacterized integral membrane protein (TIGR00697 family)